MISRIIKVEVRVISRSRRLITRTVAIRQSRVYRNASLAILIPFCSTNLSIIQGEGEAEGDRIEEPVKVLQSTDDEQLNSIPSSAEEFIDNTVSPDEMKPCEGDSLKENSEDNTSAAWWNKKLQRNAESELLDSPEDEDSTDIRFKLSSSSDSGNP